jgi:hypothetical protein
MRRFARLLHVHVALPVPASHMQSLAAMYLQTPQAVKLRHVYMLYVGTV